MMQHVIDIPLWHPTTLNRLMGVHWAKAARRKRSDRDIIGGYALLGKVPPATGRRRVSLVIIMAPKKRCPDKDCWFKSVLDGLVQAGLLKDDNPRWCEPGPVEYQRSAAWGTRIVLDDL